MTYLNYFHQTVDTHKSAISYDEEKHQIVTCEQLKPASLGFFSCYKHGIRIFDDAFMHFLKKLFSSKLNLEPLCDGETSTGHNPNTVYE